jgi:hypothetical protein
MLTEIISPNELAAKLADGYKVVKENVIAGKVRTIEVQKEGNPMAWLEEDNNLRKEYVASMAKRERDIYFRNAALRHRGMDI